MPFIPVWHDYWEANASFNVDYARNLGYGSGLDRLPIPNLEVLIGGLPLWCAALVGAIRQRNRLIWVWALCGLVSARATSLDWSHQYAFLVPPAAFLAGVGLDLLARYRIAMVSLAVGAGVVVAVILEALPWSGARPQQAMLDAIRSAKGGVYVLGDRTYIYSYAGRQPERRFFYSVPLVARRDWGEQVRQQLIACPPDLLVIPKRNVFPVDWEDDVTAGYGQRTEYDDAVLFTQPKLPCNSKS